jgi:hypothetical protein
VFVFFVGFVSAFELTLDVLRVSWHCLCLWSAVGSWGGGHIYIYIYVYIYTYIYTYTHIYIHTILFICLYTHVFKSAEGQQRDWICQKTPRANSTRSIRSWSTVLGI